MSGTQRSPAAGVFADDVAAWAMDGTGQAVGALPPGRANAASSVPVVVSNEDQANMKQTYRRAAAVGATAGDAVIVTGRTVVSSH